ncbi:MAG: carbonic anhydrase, partial [Gemmatimonadota bacterium]
LDTEEARHRRLCELNVVEQVVNVSRTTVVQDAWARGQELAVHGWIYGLEDGLLHDLGPTVMAEHEIDDSAEAALAPR